MTHTAKKKYLQSLKKSLDWVAYAEQDPDSVDWGGQEGVLISANQAKLFVSLLESHLQPAPDVAKDVAFLAEMRENTQSLLNDRYDITKVQHMDKMIEDWHRELEQKLIAGPERAEDVTEGNAARVQTRMKYRFVFMANQGVVVAVPLDEFEKHKAAYDAAIKFKTIDVVDANELLIETFMEYPPAVIVDLQIIKLTTPLI